MNGKQRKAVFFAVLAAALYALNSPFSKLLLKDVAPTMMAAFLYLGAGSGIWLAGRLRRFSGKQKTEKPLTRKELPFTVGMVLLDIAAPVLLMFGLKLTTAENAALLNNFEIVATSLIAMCFFGEKISRKLWIAVGLVSLSSAILTFENANSFSFSPGSVLVLSACVCWGFENNCTRMLSSKDPMETVVIKGFGSGLGAVLLALCLGENFPGWRHVAAAMLLGFVAYGLSIYFYIMAQRELGAAKTSAYYAVAPFIGAGLSLLIFPRVPPVTFFVALALMAAGTYLASADTKPEE